MKTRLTTLLSSAVLLALTSFGADYPGQPLPKGKGKKPALYSFVREPEERTVEIGQFAAFACRVYPEENALYQWYFKTNMIDGPKGRNREYFIDAASIAQVGSYHVRVSWKNVSNVITSANTFLSVYRRSGENPVSGTLTTTLDKFTATATFYCAANPAITFDKIFACTNYFYGPFVPLTNQTGPFINDGFHYNVRLDANSAANGTTPVGIRFLKSFNPSGYPPYELGCQSGVNPTSPIVDIKGLSTDTDVNKARYKITIYYHSPDPLSGNIDVNFTYY